MHARSSDQPGWPQVPPKGKMSTMSTDLGPVHSPNYGDYDANGVDRSLLRYMLRLTPLERLEVMERHAREMVALHELGKRNREAKTSGGR